MVDVQNDFNYFYFIMAHLVIKCHMYFLMPAQFQYIPMSGPWLSQSFCDISC